MPYTVADVEWWTRETLTEAEEMERVSLTLSEADPDEFSTPEERDEFERWLDSLAPTVEEVERRDAFIGGGAE